MMPTDPTDDSADEEYVVVPASSLYTMVLVANLGQLAAMFDIALQSSITEESVEVRLGPNRVPLTHDQDTFYQNFRKMASNSSVVRFSEVLTDDYIHAVATWLESDRQDATPTTETPTDAG
jgi:hypothetical protein